MDIRNWEGYTPPTEYIDSDVAAEDRPSFEDIREHAEAGFAKRAIARYLITKNPERSVKFYSYLGMPLLRKFIMKTYGRRITLNSGWNNYRLDAQKNTIDGAMDFAVKGSTFNEAFHSGIGAAVGAVTALHCADGLTTGEALSDGFGLLLNFSLVALQRYNRARMAKRVDEELGAGRVFSPGYKNWLGLDSRALENYKESEEEAHLQSKQAD